MAIVTCRAFSNCLHRNIEIKAICPTPDYLDSFKTGYSNKRMCTKAIYLFCGIGEAYDAWIYNTKIERLAKQFNIFVFYIDIYNAFATGIGPGELYESY